MATAPTTITIISLVIAGIGLLLFLTFATYPVEVFLAALAQRICRRRRK